jgi:hypothetical protein
MKNTFYDTTDSKVMLYAFHIGKNEKIPDRDEISRNLSLLRPLGIADNVYANKLVLDTKFENDHARDLLLDIVSKKIGLKDTKDKNKVRDLSSFLRRIFVDYGVENSIGLLFKSLNNNGIFKINEDSEYNASKKVISGIQDIFSNDDLLCRLKDVMNVLIRETPNLASTNIGPGELFFALFSEAKLAGAFDKGGKVGDLQVMSDEGKIINYELKSTLARFGGDRTIVNGPEKIKNILGTFKAEAPKLDRLYEILTELEYELDLYKESNFIPYEYFYSLFQSKHSQIHRTVRSYIEGLITFVELSNYKNYVNGMHTMVDSRGDASDSKRKKLTPLYNHISSIIKKRKDSILCAKKNIQDAGFSSNLVDNIYSSFKALTQTELYCNEDTIIELLLACNSYDENNLLKKSGNFDIRNNLKEYLFKTKTVSDVINSSYEDLEKLIGSMHLVSYANDKQFDKLLMLGVKSKNVIVFDSPKTFEKAYGIMNHKDIKIDPTVDKASGATIIGTSAMIYID